MATSVTAGVNEIIVAVDDPTRDDFGGMYVWRSITSGFTPGAGNLVYSGKDFTHIMKGLTAGVTYYVKVALFSDIDRNDYLVSAEFAATPTAPVVAAENITGLTLRGKNAFAGSFGTKGSTLTANSLNAATTLLVENTVDFPASGSAVVYSVTALRDRDVITYTGKTATSLTGVAGATAHTAGELIIPLDGTSITIDSAINELRLYGANGAGAFENLLSMGVVPSGADTVLINAGTSAYVGTVMSAYNNYAAPTIAVDNDGTGYGLQATAANTGIYSFGVAQHGVFGQSTLGFGVRGYSFGATGNFFTAGLLGQSRFGYAAYLECIVAGPERGHLRLVPFTSPPSQGGSAGDVYADADHLHYYTTAWLKLFKETDTLLAANGTAAAPGVSFSNAPGHGMFRKSASEVGFSAGSVEVFYINSSMNVNFVNNIGVGDADPTASATINAKSVATGQANRQGINNLLEINNGFTMTASRTFYGAYNEAYSIMTAPNRAGFNSVCIGALNRAKSGLTAGTVGSANILYGAFNEARHQTSQLTDTFQDLYGAWNAAVSDGAANGGDMWGSFNRAEARTAEVINSMSGVYSNVFHELATTTTAYLFRGILTHTSGTITNKWGVHVTGADKHRMDGFIETDGIKFPATQVNSSDVNTLDDYEEGTFTPVVNGTTTAGVGTYTVQQGVYTKIGNRVCLDITLVWSAHTGTGNIEIGGLPFARQGAGSSPAAIYNQGVAVTAGSTIQGAILATASVVTITQTASGTSSAVPIDTAATFRLAVTYPVN